MDNRFTIKDFSFLSLIVVLLVAVVLAMIQYDRQWTTLLVIAEQSRNQNNNLADLVKETRLLRQSITSGRVQLTGPGPGAGATPGIATTGPATAAALDPKDPFYRQREAMLNPDYADGDWLVQNMGVKLSKITPFLSTDVYGASIQARVLESLAFRDAQTLEWRPLLATDWKIDDMSDAWRAELKKRMDAGKAQDEAIEDPTMPPAVDITFNLRPNVVFSDGKPMTADDVVWSFNWVCNEQVEAPRERAYIKENIRSVQKLGDLKVVYHFKKPYFEAFSLAAGQSVLPRHFYEQFTPEQFNQSVGFLMGTGAYRLETPTGWKPGQLMRLYRNERYWGVPAPFDQFVYNEIENDAAALVEFRNGNLDLFGAQPEQYVTLKDDPDINKKNNRFEYYSIAGGYSYIGWNQKRGGKPTPFADKRVRQAMTLLIDRERMAQDLYKGYAKVADGPFNPASKQNSPDVSPYPFDPARAKALLKEAGYEDRNGDGILDGPGGVPLKFSLIYGNSNPLTERTVLAVKDGLARAGVVVELTPTDWPIMLQKLKDKDFDAITLGWSGGAETDIFQMFHTSQIKTGDNVNSYSNPKLDGLITQARSTVDEAKRMPLWQQCHEILHEDQPYTFLLVRQSLVFIDKRIKNIKASDTGLNFSAGDANPIPWYVPLDEQKHVE